MLPACLQALWLSTHRCPRTGLLLGILSPSLVLPARLLMGRCYGQYWRAMAKVDDGLSGVYMSTWLELAIVSLSLLEHVRAWALQSSLARMQVQS